MKTLLAISVLLLVSQAQAGLNTPDPRLEQVISAFTSSLASAQTNENTLYCVSPWGHRMLLAVSTKVDSDGVLAPKQVLIAMDSNNFGKVGPKLVSNDGTNKIIKAQDPYQPSWTRFQVILPNEKFGFQMIFDKLSRKMPLNVQSFLSKDGYLDEMGAGSGCFESLQEMLSQARKYSDPSSAKAHWD